MAFFKQQSNNLTCQKNYYFFIISPVFFFIFGLGYVVPPTANMKTKIMLYCTLTLSLYIDGEVELSKSASDLYTALNRSWTTLDHAETPGSFLIPNAIGSWTVQ